MEKPFHREAKPFIFEKARALKKASTPAENKLWQAIRNQKLKNCKFRRQHPIDIFILDFYCHEKNLAIEIDGGIHDDREQKEYDAGRTFELEQIGIKVIRFTNEEVVKNLFGVLKIIRQHLTPNPSPAGRGEQSISR